MHSSISLREWIVHVEHMLKTRFKSNLKLNKNVHQIQTPTSTQKFYQYIWSCTSLVRSLILSITWRIECCRLKTCHQQKVHTVTFTQNLGKIWSRIMGKMEIMWIWNHFPIYSSQDKDKKPRKFSSSSGEKNY